MNNEMRFDEPMETYLSNWKILSASGISMILDKSPRHFEEKYIQSLPTPTKDARHLTFGTDAHAIILEYLRFKDHYLCGPEGKNRTHKAFQEFAKEHPDKRVLPYSEFVTLEALRDSVMSQSLSSYLLEKEGQAEVSCYWQDLASGQSLRCRPDKLILSENLVIDIKTTGDASRSKFERHAVDLGYHRSAALSSRGLREITGEDFTYIFLVIETKSPFNVAAYFFDTEAIDIADRDIDLAIQTFQGCMESGKWPGYPTTIEQISIPPWKLKKEAV